jgi:amidase
VTGGNLDARILTTGAEVLLPVEIAGAGLFVGDVHLAQGDGELFLTGVECSASVRLTAHPVPDVHIPGPVIISDDVISILGDGQSLDEAASVASNRAVALLTSGFEMSNYDAGFVLSASAHLRVCRFLPNYGSVCRIEIRRDILNQMSPRTRIGSWLTR